MRTIQHLERVSATAIMLAMMGAGPAVAEPVAWNQEDVTRLAGEFARTLAKISSAAKAAPMQETALQQRRRDAAVRTLASLREDADGFSKRLARGQGHFETELVFQQLRKFFRETRDVAGDAVAFGEQRSNLDAAGTLLEKLARYYDD